VLRVLASQNNKIKNVVVVVVVVVVSNVVWVLFASSFICGFSLVV